MNLLTQKQPGLCVFLLSIISLLLLVSLSASAQVSVLTQHNDNLRTGGNLSETTLNTTDVNVNSFGKIFSLPVDGYIFAQPLYVPNVSIAGGIHNVVYIATAHDSVYAFDADTGTQYWQTSLGTSVPSSVIGTVNILVEVGIIGTPVIDTSNGTIYVVAKTYENSAQIFRLHALNILTGAEETGSPVLISAQVTGTGDGGANGQVAFLASQENQRPGLALVNGAVYIAFASHEDYDPYHGWVLAYSEKGLQQVGVFNDTPNGGRGGIWMGGQGPVVDATGNIYFMSGNSNEAEENSTGDFGESFVKLGLASSGLSELDYFKANNYDTLNAYDIDLGSGGPVGIPGTTDIVGGGKQGLLYVVNTSNMGQLNMNADQVVQEWQGDDYGIWGSPIYWNSATPALYVWGQGDNLKEYSFSTSTGLFSTTPATTSSFTSVSGNGCIGLSVSSNGSAAGTGIVWAEAPGGDPDHTVVPGTLYAFDATNLNTELWDSMQDQSRDDFGSFGKFVSPTVANGKVYVGTESDTVAVYGELQDFLLSSSPNSVSVNQGASTTSTITVTPSGGFTGT